MAQRLQSHRVELMTDGFMLDKLVVKPALPEPATWMLLVLGGVVVLVNLNRSG